MRGTLHKKASAQTNQLLCQTLMVKNMNKKWQTADSIVLRSMQVKGSYCCYINMPCNLSKLQKNMALLSTFRQAVQRWHTVTKLVVFQNF